MSVREEPECAKPLKGTSRPEAADERTLRTVNDEMELTAVLKGRAAARPTGHQGRSDANSTGGPPEHREEGVLLSSFQELAIT